MTGNRGLEDGRIKKVSDTIASGTTTAEFDIEGGTLVAIGFPADMTSTTFTITVSDTPNVEAGTFTTLKDPIGVYAGAGNDISFTVAATATGVYTIPPAMVTCIQNFKVVMGSSETAKVVDVYFRSIE